MAGRKGGPLYDLGGLCCVAFLAVASWRQHIDRAWALSLIQSRSVLCGLRQLSCLAGPHCLHKSQKVLSLGMMRLSERVCEKRFAGKILAHRWPIRDGSFSPWNQ